MLNNSLNLQWIPGTSNIVERLFGRAKLTLDDKKLSHILLEVSKQLYRQSSKY